MGAAKYYAKERRKYRRELNLEFKDFREVERAIEYLSRKFTLPYLVVEQSYDGRWSYFRPDHWLRQKGAHFRIQDHHANLYTVAHEFAHYVDYERAIADGRWRHRGHAHRWFRWHSRQHAELTAECVRILLRRLGE